MRDYYDILGVSKNADDTTLKKAYRDLSKELIKTKGGNINLDYKKYLKYKNKYMQLKNKEN